MTVRKALLQVFPTSLKVKTGHPSINLSPRISEELAESIVNPYSLGVILVLHPPVWGCSWQLARRCSACL